MAYRRGGFALTPPSIVVFVISAILAVIALLVYYGGVRVPVIGRAHAFDALAIGYVLLVAGVVFRRL